MHNNNRYDLTNRLIHFYRPINQEIDGCFYIPEYFGWSDIYEDGKMSALFLLRASIRHSMLVPTWSIRGGKRTIYGPFPACCFTEMPLPAFIETALARQSRSEKISPYALSFKKKDLFKLGARPAIYGLTSNSISYPNGENGQERLFEETILPKQEQYRFITYNLTEEGKNVDWTHEREWRLPYTNLIVLKKTNEELNEYGIISELRDIPKFDLSDGILSDIGVIVQKSSDVKKILYDILCLIYRKKINKNKYSFIIDISKIHDVEKIRSSEDERQLLANSMIKIDDFLEPNSDIATSFLEQIRSFEEEIEQKSNNEKISGKPSCWLWFYDIFDNKVRSLLNQKKAFVNEQNKILLKTERLNLDVHLNLQENKIERLASKIEQKFGIKCGYFSKLPTSSDIAPYFNSQNQGDFDRIYYNYSCDA